MDVFAIIYINIAIEKSIHFSFTLDFFVIIVYSGSLISYAISLTQKIQH